MQDVFHESSSVIDSPTHELIDGPLLVEFQNVSFAYADEFVISNIDFSLEPGKVLGILGRTGGGKTTMARLLFRLYDPQSGSVLINGKPLSSYSLQALRERIAVITQNVYIFNASVRDNLTFFSGEIADDRIVRALADLGLDEWYASLPQGLDTKLATDGAGLSAGEALLLAFTRIMLLRSPGLIILDEASSRMDPATERFLNISIKNLLKHRTGIIIAHRLSTIRNTDEILILDRGHILERGNRDELESNPTSHFAKLLKTGLESTERTT